VGPLLPLFFVRSALHILAGGRRRLEHETRLLGEVPALARFPLLGLGLSLLILLFPQLLLHTDVPVSGK